MNNLTNEEIDKVMSEIGMRLANKTLGKPLDDDDVDDILVKALATANEEQRFEVVDNMIDFFAVVEVFEQATSDDNLLDEDELKELTAYLGELRADTEAVMIDLVK